MEKVRKLFFDTYALLEIIKGNKDYGQYKENITLLTTKLNLMEMHYVLLRTMGKEEADKYYDELVDFSIEVDNEVIKAANELKLSLKKKNLSYIDCVGYIIAKTTGVKFLTGDKEFKDLENVEFVK